MMNSLSCNTVKTLSISTEYLEKTYHFKNGIG